MFSLRVERKINVVEEKLEGKNNINPPPPLTLVLGCSKKGKYIVKWENMLENSLLFYSVKLISKNIHDEVRVVQLT